MSFIVLSGIWLGSLGSKPVSMVILASGDKIPAPMDAAALLIFSPKLTPGKLSIRRPASHFDVLLSGAMIVSL